MDTPPTRAKITRLEAGLIEIDRREHGMVASIPLRKSRFMGTLLSLVPIDTKNTSQVAPALAASKPLGGLVALAMMAVVIGDFVLGMDMFVLTGSNGRPTHAGGMAGVVLLIPLLLELDFRARQQRFHYGQDAKRVHLIVERGQVTLGQFVAPLHDCRLAAVGDELHALRPSTDQHATWPTQCSELALRNLVASFDELRDQHGSSQDVPQHLRELARERS